MGSFLPLAETKTSHCKTSYSALCIYGSTLYCTYTMYLSIYISTLYFHNCNLHQPSSTHFSYHLLLYTFFSLYRHKRKCCKSLSKTKPGDVSVLFWFVGFVLNVISVTGYVSISCFVEFFSLISFFFLLLLSN